ncbi:hypothetical protein ABKN59_001497 [Abortiporus biennis]
MTRFEHPQLYTPSPHKPPPCPTIEVRLVLNNQTIYNLEPLWDVQLYGQISRHPQPVSSMDPDGDCGTFITKQCPGSPEVTHCTGAAGYNCPDPDFMIILIYDNNVEGFNTAKVAIVRKQDEVDKSYVRHLVKNPNIGASTSHTFFDMGIIKTILNLCGTVSPGAHSIVDFILTSRSALFLVRFTLS